MIFSEAREKEIGHPEPAQKFFAQLGGADAVLISFAEHNASYPVAYKNMTDAAQSTSDWRSNFHATNYPANTFYPNRIHSLINSNQSDSLRFILYLSKH